FCLSVIRHPPRLTLFPTRRSSDLLTALCTALPAQLGMVIIGGEGALLIGALAATGAALMMQSAPPLVVQLAMVGAGMAGGGLWRSEEHTSELQSLRHLVCRLLLEK